MKKEIEHFQLDEKFDASIIKSLNKKELEVLSDDCRKLIIEKCSEFGGHLSSNLGVVELTIALFKYYDFPKDKLLFDVGHQSYTEKILTGRPLNNLRQENGIDGFQKRQESKFDCFEAGHSSTSLSTAMGMAIARDLDNENYQIVTVIGDASIANGVSFEALNNLDGFNHKLVIILNDNEMSITNPVGAFNQMLQKMRISKNYIKSKDNYVNAMKKNKFTQSILNFTSKIKNKIKRHLFYTNVFEDMGIYYIGIVDGTNFKELEHAFKMADNVNKPVIIHVSTKKGKGYKFAEEDQIGKWHYTRPFDIETGKLKNSEEGNFTSWAHIYSRYLEKEMSENKEIISINPATGLGSDLLNIKKMYPERYFDVGISEEHAILFASGMALNKYHPYVTIYSSFLQRSYDEIHHDISRMNLPVTIMVDHAGLVGQDGETHQGIYDEDFLRNIPNMLVAMAKDKYEACQLFKFSLNYKGPFAIRYPVGKVYDDTFDYENVNNLSAGDWKIEKKSMTKKVALISYGPHLKEIINECEDKELTIVNAIFTSIVNMKVISSIIDYENIIIYDPYSIEQGFTNDIKLSLLQNGYKGKIIVHSIPKIYVKKATILEQEQNCGVDVKKIIEDIKTLI